MAGQRQDAARSRERILATARAMRAAGEALQLNAVARRAKLGVGTVYRHFASTDALGEGVVEGRFTELAGLARERLDDADAVAALRSFLVAAMEIYVAEPLFAAATVTASPARAETVELRRVLLDAVADLVARVSDRLRPGIDATDLMVLVCGLGYSASRRPDRAAAYVDVLLAGVANDGSNKGHASGRAPVTPPG